MLRVIFQIDRTKLKEIFLEAIKGKPVPKKEYSQSRIMLSIIAEEMGIPLSSIDARFDTIHFQEVKVWDKMEHHHH